MSYDLAILGLPSNRASALSVSNEAADGLYKLMQKILILLFTDKTSAYSAGIGTTVPSNISAANTLDKKVVQGIFKIGLATIRETIQSQTPYDAPLDEKLRDFDVVVSDGETQDSLSVQLTITSVANGTISVRIPITNLFTSQE